ncbi:hypothetical protein H6P81_013196 [Aristolochia fimbriata]|uniref:SREBP regulating gene protein n=1 Tax=Aristolochia fimbriata TaxID=158543 RepID=A0AAV7EE06_ARIFI|nr:hypothetical protein H6P81_013196 [Aristolochia fimbriata]
MRKSCISLPLLDTVYNILCCAILLQFTAKTLAIRKDGSFLDKHICRTTVQGRYLISDDNGHVCDALSLDRQSRCCPRGGESYSCQGCNLVSQCCSSYEYCVSCCLNPARTPKDLALKVKVAKPATAGTYASSFDFCAGRCRHNSASVVHENAYASEFHHCFSLPSNSTVHLGVLDSSSDTRLAGIGVVVAKQGESCNSVCKSKGQLCVPNKLLVLNNCELLQKYMSCKGACFPSIGTDQPAEVVDDAPKNMNPGACLYTRSQELYLIFDTCVAHMPNRKFQDRKERVS